MPADQLRHRVDSVTDTKNKEENSPKTKVKKFPEIVSEPERPRVASELD